MLFPKAASGIKKINISQILFIIGFSLSIIISVINIILDYSAQESNSESASPSFLIILSYLAISIMMAGFVLMIIGVFIASGDDENFKVALYSVVFGVALSIISTIWSKDVAVGSITELLITLTSYLALIYVIQGIRNLALKLDKNDIEHQGSILYTVFSVFYLLETCIIIAILIFSDTEAFVQVLIFQIARDVMSFVQNLLFMIYLVKAKNMLIKKKNK